MKKFTFAVLLGLCILSASCEKDKGSAPVPPPAATLAVDFSSFAATKAGGQTGIDDFFTYASTQALANWVSLFEKVISTPVEAYSRFQMASAPVENGDGWSWFCTYTDALNQKYSVELYGEWAGKRVNWEVRVSKDGLLGYEDFCWVTGWSDKDGSCGQWKVKVSPIDTDVVVTSDWKADGENVQEVKLTYALNHLCFGINPFFHDSWIIYSASATDPAYDHSVSSSYNHMGLGFWTVNVEWNSETGAGRVNSQNKFGDTMWHCWNPHHEDI